MLENNYSEKMMDLEDVKITNVENFEKEVHIYIELPRKEHICPACGAYTSLVHDYRMQVVKDIPMQRTTYLHLKKRRYRCGDCGKRFAEKNSFLPRYHRSTSRMNARIIESLQKLRSYSDVAETYNVSPSTVRRYFDHVSYKLLELPEVLSIDEFKGNAGKQKYQTILTDPANKKILDILPNRYESDLISYFSQFSSRKNVKYFISDMNPHFRSVAKVCFPDAIIIADKYHVIRQAVWAMERVRKTEQSRLSRRFRIYFKRSKYLLNKPRHKLTENEMNQLSLMLEIAPRLADAYRLKNEFVAAMKSTNSIVGRERLLDWLQSATVLNLPEFNDCQRACHNWFQEILNSLDAPWTNGFTEGCNNKTKVLKRVSYGVGNFERFRNRILHCSN